MNTKNASRIFLCLLLIIAGPSYAQSLLIGKVTDKRTGEALEEVKVYWFLGDTKKELTDEEGVYRIGIDTQSDILVFELSGKKKKFIPANKQMRDSLFWELNVEMEDQDISASTASHWEQSVYEIPASTVIIDRDEIERNGYMNLQEVLESVPGFYTIDHRSESDITLGVRGFWAPFNRNVMIQVNGVNMLSERQNDFPFNKINVPIESIERVEIVRGPLSVIYGAGAFFGVINIITLDPVGGEVSGHISSGWGTQNQFNQDFQYSLHKDGLLLSLSAMNSMRDGFTQDWDDMVSDTYYQADAAENQAKGYNTIYAYQNQRINSDRYSKEHQSVNFALRYEGFSANMNYARSNFGFSFLHPGPKERNDYISSTTNIQFGYSGGTPQIRRKNKDSYRQFNYEVKAGHMSSLVDADYNYFLPDSYTPGEDRVATLRTEANTLWTIMNNENTEKSIVLTSGLAYTRNYQNASIYNAAEFDLRNWYVGLAPNSALQTSAFYSQLDVKLKNLQFIGGGRLERQGAYEMLNQYNVDFQFDVPSDPNIPIPPQDTNIYINATNISDVNTQNNTINFIPRLAVLYKFLDHDSSAHYLRAMYSEAIKQSSVIDNAFDVMSAGDTTLSYLRPEEIKTFEIGYTFNYETEDYELQQRKTLMLNVNTFANILTDLVTRQTAVNSSGNYVARSRNSDRLETYGVELITSGMYSLPRTRDRRSLTFHANANITLQRTFDKARGNSFEVPFSPNLLSGMSIGFQLGKTKQQSTRFQIGSSTLTMGLNYVGKMKAYFDNSEFNSDGEAIIPDYIGEDTEGYAICSLNMRINDIRFWKLKVDTKKEVPGGFYFNARISNLFNKKYRYPTYTLNPWADRGMLGRPQQLLVTIGYQF